MITTQENYVWRCDSCLYRLIFLKIVFIMIFHEIDQNWTVKVLMYYGSSAIPIIPF